jgi:uncharacterized membrane protein HdeD (DUF308 family)
MIGERERKTLLRLKRNKDKSGCWIVSGVMALCVGVVFAVLSTLTFSPVVRVEEYFVIGVFLSIGGVLSIRDAIAYKNLYSLVEALLRNMSTDMESVVASDSTEETEGSARR